MTPAPRPKTVLLLDIAGFGLIGAGLVLLGWAGALLMVGALLLIGEVRVRRETARR
ncbi:hypothetical protein [Nocardia terpenica]|uniref:hypothetical protein n=1 Tax=Nocardia terpenica TaxID=455432 RepID=UPI0012FD0D4E|nr:hypothetical protein [Nocardia terpenica]